MKPSKLALTALAGLITIPVTSLAADDVSYTYAEIDYVVQDIDLFEDDEAFDNILDDFDDGDGFQIGGSFEFIDSWFAFGSYSNTEADFTFVNDTGMTIPNDEDIKTLRLGVGFFTPIATRTDFVATASYVDVDYGDFNLGATESELDEWDAVDDALRDLDEDQSDGYSLDAGVRSQIVEWLELGGGLRYTDLDTGDDFSLFANALFELNQNMGINLSADFADEVSTYALGFRYSWDS